MNVTPYELGKEGNTKRVNPSQCMPRLSAETHKHAGQWNTLQEIFQAIFEWIGEQVSIVLFNILSYLLTLMSR